MKKLFRVLGFDLVAKKDTSLEFGTLEAAALHGLVEAVVYEYDVDDEGNEHYVTHFYKNTF